MNKAAVMHKIAFILPFLLLSACHGGQTPGGSNTSAQGDLVGAAIGGPFTLTDQDGKTVHWSDFAGKYRLVYFGYTYCPDVCPLDLAQIMAGFRNLEKSDPAKAAKVQPMFITVDPVRDTPAKLKTYVGAFHPRLIGLTGPVDEIEKVKREFVVVASKAGDEKATKDYFISHTRTPYLFDPDGKPIALVPVDDTRTPQNEASPDAVMAFLKKWVK
jgi:protein SCO1